MHQNNQFSKSKDGMDIALLYFNTDLSTVQYAGANNSLYLIRNGILNKTKANDFQIGINEIEKLIPFSNFVLQLQKGDMLYIFSNGFIDQFGGIKKEKFMKKPFKELLLSHHNKSIDDQGRILGNTFNNWKGNLD